jgi:hypothetical protein
MKRESSREATGGVPVGRVRGAATRGVCARRGGRAANASGNVRRGPRRGAARAACSSVAARFPRPATRGQRPPPPSPVPRPPSPVPRAAPEERGSVLAVGRRSILRQATRQCRSRERRGRRCIPRGCPALSACLHSSPSWRPRVLQNGSGERREKGRGLSVPSEERPIRAMKACYSISRADRVPSRDARRQHRRGCPGRRFGCAAPSCRCLNPREAHGAP